MAHLPPVKMFKHMQTPASHVSQSTSLPQPTGTIESMHRSVMNGPKLSPRGQLSPYSNEDAAQSRTVASSSHSHGYTNGHTQPTPSTNGHTIQYDYRAPHLPSADSNGKSRLRKDVSGSAGADRSSRYQQETSPLSAQSQAQFSYPPQNPFLNSFNRQRPSSAHSSNNVTSPMKNRPSMTPTQGNRDVGPIAFPSAKHASNSASPAYLDSSTHSSSYRNHQHSSSPSSSPILPAPDQQQHFPMSGLSPSKNSSPRPMSSHSVSGTAIMPPVAQLSPSPQIQNFHAPIKGLTPQQPSTTNGTNGHFTE